MNNIYPFKFLDSYGKDDTQLFFGRDEEINAMYQMIFQSNILLVYGASGTGKTSLIQCGLAGRFQAHDWLALNIRRGNDLNTSLQKVLAEAGEGMSTPDDEIDITAILEEDDGKATKKLSPLGKLFKAIYLKYFRPIYLIFDQFEELFILGTPDEQGIFIRTVKEILQLDQPVKMIFSIREEYIGELFEFEKEVPQLLRKKLRVEPMNLDKVGQVIVGATSLKGSNVSIKPGEEESVTEAIFEKIKGREKSLTIQLPYLQVFLDKLYLDTTRDNTRKKEAVFSLETLDRIGDIDDILQKFLDDQVNAVSQQINVRGTPVTTEKIWKILSPFATLDGTKEPLSMQELRMRLPEIHSRLVTDIVEAFVTKRIIRQSDDGQTYELAHDSLAGKIASKRSDEEIALLEVKKLIANQAGLNNNARDSFSEKQLNFIEPYLDKLSLTDDEQKLIASSQLEIRAIKGQKARRFRQTLYAMIAGIIIISGFTVWAVKARNDAIKAQQSALQQKTAAESLVLSGQSHIRYYRYGDPTFGFRFAQYAYQKDSNNLDARRAIYTAIFQPWHKPERHFRRFSIWHTEFVYSALPSPDGDRLLTASQDSTARIWDIQTGKELVTFKNHKDYVLSANWSPDGTKVVSTSADGTARIWDASSGKQLLIFRHHRGTVTSAAFSPDNKQVASISSDSTLRIWDAQTGAESKIITKRRIIFTSISFSPDGSKILTLQNDSSVTLWNVITGQETVTFKGSEHLTNYTCFSHDGESMATASFDNIVCIWDIKTGSLKQKLTGHSNHINRVVFSKDDNLILSASDDKTAKLWNIRKGHEQATFEGHTSSVKSASFSNDELMIVTGSADHTAKIWDKDGNELATLAGHTSAILNAYFTPRDKHIVTSSFDYSEKVWMTASRQRLGRCLGDTAIFTFILRPTPHQVISSDSKRLLTILPNNSVAIWDAIKYNIIDTLMGHRASVNSAVFSHSSKYILTASADNTATIWDGSTYKPLKVLRGHTKPVHSAFYSADDSKIITRSADNTVIIWDAISGKMLQTLSNNGNQITSAVFSPDNRSVATASSDNTVRLWSTVTGKELQRFSVGVRGVNSATFSSDGKKIIVASGDDHAHIWDLVTGKTTRLYGHGGPVLSAVFSPDGRKALTASSDNTAKLWDVETGKEIVELSEHTAAVYTAFFSYDGRSIITSSGDNTARLWDTETGKELATLRGNKGHLYAAYFSPDGAHVMATSTDHTSKIWLISISQIINFIGERIEDLYDEDKETYNITNKNNIDYSKPKNKHKQFINSY